MTASFRKLWAIQNKPHSISTFFSPPEHESMELHIVFDIPENGFGLSAPSLAQGQAQLREQVLPGLLAIALEFKADLHAAIAAGSACIWDLVGR